MRDNDMNLKVGLKNEASPGLKQISKDVKSFAEQFKSATPQVEGMTASVLRFGTGVAVGNLATLAARKILSELSQQVRETLRAFNEMQSAMIGLSSVAGAFGVAQDEARGAAQELAQDGLMTVNEAAEGLKNLLASGFGLQEATDLMYGFKDAAAFNRQGTLEFGQAIVGATQGIKNQNSIMVDNVGVTKNLSVIMKEAGLSIDDLSKISTDAAIRQKFYNGIIRETTIFQGDAARASDTLQGAQSRLKTAIFNLQATIGSALAPAMEYLVSSMTTATNNAQGGLTPALTNVAKAGVWLVGVFKEIGLIIKTLVQPVFAIVKATIDDVAFSLRSAYEAARKLVKGDFKEAWNELKKGGEMVAERNSLAIQSIVDNYKSFLPESQRIAEEMGIRLDKINTEGLQGFTDVAREAVKSLGDVVDKDASKIAESLEKEIRSFAKSLQRLAKNFDESMRDLVISHKEKVEEIKSQIEEESKAIEDEVESITAKYKDELAQFKKAAEERLTSLQVQLDREIAKGKLADQEKIKALETMLEKEKIALADQQTIREGIIQDEIEEAKSKYQEKIDELNDSLNEELELQKQYADEFAKFRDAVRLDDFAQLKQKYADELQLLKEAHEERLNEIKKQAQAESQYGSSGASGSGTSSGKSWTPEQLANVLVQKGGYNWTDAWNAANNAGGRADELAKEFLGLAEGGIVRKPTLSWVGEAGEEAVIPLTKPNRANEIMEQAGLNKSLTINMPTQVISSNIDIDLVVERLAFRLSKEGLI